MSEDFILEVEARSDLGKGASRRLRRLEAKVPAILYGGENTPPQGISTPLKALVKHLESEAFYSHILTLKLDGQEIKAVLKDLQRHPAKGFPMHADFLRVDTDHKITMHVPIHFINEEKCVGVKSSGGIISHQANDVEVICFPQDLPEFIEVNVENLNVGESLHLSDLTLPPNVKLVELSHGDEHNNDLTLVSVQAPRGGSDEAEAGEAADEENK